MHIIYALRPKDYCVPVLNIKSFKLKKKKKVLIQSKIDMHTILYVR